MASIFTIQNFFIYIFPIITLFIGWLWHKQQTKKNEITHFSINSYDVGKGLHDEFPNFQLYYQGKELQNEVQVLKGGFINTGRDIIGLTGESDIHIILPKGCNVRDIKVQKLNDELLVNTKSNIDSRLNVIDFGIEDKLLHKEGFNYTAIIETNDLVEPLHKKLEIKHRIPNTTIKQEFIGQGNQAEANRNLGVLICLFGLISFCISVFFLYQEKVQYIVHEKKTNKEVVLYRSIDSQLFVADKDNFLPFAPHKKITKEEFLNNYSISPKTLNSGVLSQSLYTIIIVLFYIFILCCGFMIVHKSLKSISLINLLKLKEKAIKDI